MQSLSAPRASRLKTARMPSRSTTISLAGAAPCRRGSRCPRPRSRSRFMASGDLADVAGPAFWATANPIVPTAAVTAAVMTGQAAMTRGVTTRTVLMRAPLLVRDDRACRVVPIAMYQISSLRRALDVGSAGLSGAGRRAGRGPGPSSAGGSVPRSWSSTAARSRRGSPCRIAVSRSLPWLKASNSPEMIASSISAPLKPSLSRARRSRSNFAGSRLRFVEVDAEDLAPLGLGGQIDEEDLVEAALAQQLGRQVADVVGRGDDEHRRGLLREPGQERAEDARGGAAVAAGRALASRRRPCRSRRSRGSPARRSRPSGSRAACSPRSSRPGCRTSGRCRTASSGSFHRLDAALAQRLLPQPCTPSSSTPLGAGRPNCAARSLKATLRLRSQSLRLSSPATSAESLLALVVFQQAALADDLLLLAEDDADVVGVELAVEHQRLGEDVLRLLERQPAGRVQQPLAALGVEVDLDLRLVLHVLDDPIEQPVEVARPTAVPNSTTVTSFVSSSGIFMIGETSTIVLYVSRSAWATSRSRRMIRRLPDRPARRGGRENP